MEETPDRASLEKLGCRTPPQLHAGGVGRQQQHGDKTAAAFICQSFEFSKRLPDKASIFNALCYIRITVKNNKFVVFGD